MTLSKQLIIIISIVFAILFIGTLTMSINNMRAYLTQQLESHAQDTASSLGLSLTPHVKSNDVALMNSMIDAIFDRGYYQHIKLVDIKGKKIIERTSPVVIENVPAWFIQSIPLKTPEAVSTISSGWKQAARVHVSSHPGYAYFELWNNAVETFGWFLLSFTGAIISFIIVLKYILLPLKLVEQQAIAITRREFPILKIIPKTRELKRVVVAMNKMSHKIKSILTRQTHTIERIQKEAYIDKLTGVANRRSFDLQLDHMMHAVDEFSRAALLFVRIKGLMDINIEKGYQEGDAVIVGVAEVIKRCLEKYPHAFVARTSGEQFAILLPNESLARCNEIAKELAYQIPLGDILNDKTDVCHIGGAWYHHTNEEDGKTSVKDLLVKADLALRTSMNQAPNSSYVLAMDETQSELNIGAQLWAKALREVIQQQQFHFFQQPIMSLKTDKKLHSEIFTKILSDDGELMSGMHFIPMAEKMGLMPNLDRSIVENFIEQFKEKAEAQLSSYALNISPSSFHDDEFVAWLYEKLQSEPDIAPHLILETSEYVVSSNTEHFKKIVHDFHALGCRFSLDHFGTAFTPFGYLHDLKLDYIKIYGGLVSGVCENKDNRFFIQSLCQIAHGLDIEVIAEFVEKEKDYIVLKELGVNAVQGYYIGQLTEY